MIDTSSPTKVKSRCTSLRNNWTTRNNKFKDWYNILSLKNELEQTGMESVTSNDPRTGYNLGRHLLTSSVIAHKIYDDGFLSIQVPSIGYVEAYTEKRWNAMERSYRKQGRRGWIDEFGSFMLAFGWYAVFAMVTPDDIWAEVWHPAEVFPEFGPDGITEVAHIYPLEAGAANKKVLDKGWSHEPFKSKTTAYDYWWFDDSGAVSNCVIMGNEFVKPPTPDPYLSSIKRIPVFTSPVGGLPDKGVIVSSAEWQKHYGESIVSTNEDLTRNYNRMLSFLQQATRNAAQPRWLETSAGDTPIASEEAMNKWGTILRGQPGEDVKAILSPSIPVELTQTLFKYENMLQRGLFAASMFGNIQQTMSYLAMANVASSSIQTMSPYVEGLRGLLSDIDDFWYGMMQANNFRPYNFEMPQNMPESIEFDVQVDIEIPGYLVQRATVARMLDPTFQLSTETVMRRLFPEIKDPLKEQAKARKDMAMSNPKAIMADQIIAYREQAVDLKAQNNPDAAKLYEKLANSMEAELGVPAQATSSQTAQANRQATLNEVLPREFATGGA